MWKVNAAIACLAFAGMILFFRFAAKFQVPPAVLMSLLTGSALVCYISHSVVLKQPWPTLPVTGMILAAGLLSYIGNLMQTRAVYEAPNPGYAMAIIYLNVALITAGAAIFLGADFSLRKILGTLLCLSGVVLISLPDK